MTMHLIKGIRVTGKSKIKRKPGWEKAQQEHNEWLRSMGINPDKKARRPRKGACELPDLSTQSNNTVPTSDKICANGSIKDTVQYTGNEIAGIVVTHKSNLMPIRKDNPQAAKDAASMRR